MQQKNDEGAIAVFERNADAYESNNWHQNYLWLAQAYEENNDVTNTLKNYKKAYSIAKETSYGDLKSYRVKECECLFYPF